MEDHGDAERAVDDSLAARDAGRAARLVGAHWLEVAGARGAAPVIDRWLERLPPAVVLGDPSLCLTRAVLEEARGAPRPVVERWLDAAERSPGGAPGVSPLPFGTDSVLLESALVRAASDGQDVGRRLRSATRARRLAASAGPFARTLAGTHLAYAQWQAGRHADALATAREATEQDGARALPLLGAIQRAIASLAMAALGDDAGADGRPAPPSPGCGRTGTTRRPRRASCGSRTGRPARAGVAWTPSTPCARRRRWPRGRPSRWTGRTPCSRSRRR